MSQHTPTHYEVAEYDGTQYFRIVEVGSVKQVVALTYRRDVAEDLVRVRNSHEALLEAAKDALNVVANWYDQGQRDDVARLLLAKLTTAIAQAEARP